jgi:hypothetical protein
MFDHSEETLGLYDPEEYKVNGDFNLKYIRIDDSNPERNSGIMLSAVDIYGEIFHSVFDLQSLRDLISDLQESEEILSKINFPNSGD